MQYLPSDHPYLSDDFEVSMLDGEMILFSSKTDKVLYLNESSRMIWELCNGDLSVMNIIKLLTEAYPDAIDEIESDINTTFENLYEGGAIRFSSTPIVTNT